MAKKYDGVLEAVHYNEDGTIAWVRVYVRKGPIFTDRLVWDRKKFVDYLKTGKNFMVGSRVELMGNRFTTTEPVKLASSDGKDILVTGDRQADRDNLEGVPVI